MFAQLKLKKPYTVDAKTVYAKALDHIRQPVFYTDYGVPDTFDGRFDLLLVHIFMVMHAADDEAFNQALFDATFADLDQTLREMGIGDMGVPKHMRKMMKAFNGRMHVYDDALNGGDLNEALKRNLFGTVEGVKAKDIKAFASYFKKSVKALQEFGDDTIIAGDFEFKDAA